jgi:hypothetical protein
VEGLLLDRGDHDGQSVMVSSETELLEIAFRKANSQWATIRGGCETSMTPPSIVGVADFAASSTESTVRI